MPKIDEKKQIDKLNALEAYLNGKYSFRNNVVLNEIEYSLKGKNDYKEVADLDLLKEVRQRGKIYASDKLLSEVVGSSDVSPKHNPVKQWLESLKPPTSNPFDQLIQVIDLDDETDKSRLQTALERWFIAAVKCIYEPLYAPKQMIVFQGESGLGKTPFLNSFLPDNMADYRGECNDISPQNKDSRLLLTKKALLLFDELDNFFKHQPNRLAFKAFATQAEVNVRAPYAKNPKRKSRISSFLGSCNTSTFINDPTGSQRFVVFHVKKIWHSDALEDETPDDNRDIPVEADKFDFEECWAWGYAQYRAGASPNYSPAELRRNEERNGKYKEHTPEFEAIQEALDRSSKEQGGEHMTSTEIMGYLNSVQVDAQFRNVKEIGKALIALQFERKNKKTNRVSRWGYWVKKLQNDTVGKYTEPSNPIGNG